MVNIIKPQLAIPVHYGELVGSVADGRKFEDAVEDPVKVEFKIRFRGE